MAAQPKSTSLDSCRDRAKKKARLTSFAALPRDDTLQNTLYAASPASAFFASADALAARSNLHSVGFLSKRNPSNTGARIFVPVPPLCPACVHSENLISATSSGFTKWTGLVLSTLPKNGLRLVSSACSRFHSAACDSSVKPLPAWPT